MQPSAMQHLPCSHLPCSYLPHSNGYAAIAMPHLHPAICHAANLPCNHLPCSHVHSVILYAMCGLLLHTCTSLTSCLHLNGAPQAMLSKQTAVLPCSWFGTDNHTFTITSEYPALGVYPPPGSKPLPARTFNSFSAAAIDTGNSRYAVLNELRRDTGTHPLTGHRLVYMSTVS